VKRVVLVRPGGPRNVGMIVRETANFGPCELVLVAPELPSLLVHPEFQQMSHGVPEARERCRVVATLEEALADCTFSVGFTARPQEGRPRHEWRAKRDELGARGADVRLRTPTIVRPEDRKTVDKWLALGTPVLTGHLGLLAELAAAGRDVIADYATNAFNQLTAAELLGLGARGITLSIELTGDEMRQVAAPWGGAGFEVFAYGRPEGMTLEHCVLSAAFDREATTCRDLCVQKHTHVELTDPAGYTFPLATDSACRNRLLHSRPVDASEYLPALWRDGFRRFRLVFNVPGDPVAEVTAAYRTLLDALRAGTPPDPTLVRAITGREYTRGHFARAV